MALAAVLTPAAAHAQQVVPSASTRLNELGPENGQMARRVGTWDVTETVWETPDASPVVTTGLVAERQMMGSLLQEFIRSSGDDTHREVKRTDLLSFNRLEGRWGYVSFDTRVPVGLMPAGSTTRGEPDGRIVLTFSPFAVPGPGPQASGQLLRMEQIITFQGSDRDTKDQYFTLADGTGTQWLAHRYAYVRRPEKPIR